MVTDKVINKAKKKRTEFFSVDVVLNFVNERNTWPDIQREAKHGDNQSGVLLSRKDYAKDTLQGWCFYYVHWDRTAPEAQASSSWEAQASTWRSQASSTWTNKVR